MLEMIQFCLQKLPKSSSLRTEINDIDADLCRFQGLEKDKLDRLSVIYCWLKREEEKNET